MGMFDSVYFKCPACGKDIEVQSKAGPCVLLSCDESDVPAAIAGEILGERVSCECGKYWRVASHHLIKTLPMFLAPAEPTPETGIDWEMRH